MGEPRDILPPALTRKIASLRERFESDWRHGNGPRIESFVATASESERGAVQQALVRLDYELRSAAGQRPALADYLRRFPEDAQAIRELRLEQPPPASGDPRGDTSPRSKPDVLTGSAGAGGDGSTELPEQFGRYRIIRRLAKGGMGSVYLAHDPQLDRRVALKVPQLIGDSGGEILERFYREARAAATIHHANVCPVFDVGEIDGKPYLTMAYIDGRPLRELIDAASSGTPLEERHVASLVRTIALAMAAAHRKGVVHRDLKPENVMLDESGEPVIMDFGIARRTYADDLRLTKTGQLLGTPYYMSPEQVKGEVDRIGPPTDIYSLGVMLYELLSGALPFQGASLSAVWVEILTVEPPPVTARRPNVPPALAAICATAMAKKLDERFASMNDFAGALTDFLNAPATSRTERAPPQVPVDRGTLLPEPEDERSPRPAPRQRAREAGESKRERRAGTRRRGVFTAIAGGLVAIGLLVATIVVLQRESPSLQGPVESTSSRPPQPPLPEGGSAGGVGVAEAGVEPSPGAGGSDAAHELAPSLPPLRRGGRGGGEPEDPANDDSQPPSIAATPSTDDPPPPDLPRKPAPTPVSNDDAPVSAPVSARSPAPPVAPKVAARVDPKPVAPPKPETSPPSPSAETQPPQTVTNSVGMKLTLIPAGEFQMGSDESDKDASGDERPRHRVRITQPFYLATHEITRGQFRTFVEASGYETEAESDGAGGWGYNVREKKIEGRKPVYNWRNTGWDQTDDHPVVNVSWNDAQAFVKWLNGKENVAGYRLPTEAEWEYACRAGTTTRYQGGDDAETLARFGNVADRTAKAQFSDWTTIEARDGYVFTAPVGKFQSNAFGLHDMHGNVWEWCQDWYDGKYYGTSPVDDPPGPAGGSNRVYRGGGWNVNAAYCWSAFRGRNSPAYRISSLGFRVARRPVR